LTLPIPVFNVINGGSHAGNKLAMQEFMLFPHGATSFTEAMRMGSETYHHLKALTKKKFGQDATNVGDEGGFAPNILVNSDALDLIVASIEAAGYTGKIGIAMDVAASEFWKADINKYDLGKLQIILKILKNSQDFKNEDAGDLNDEKRYLTPTQLADVYCSFIKEYPVVSIEDPFDQDDWEGMIIL
jgi:enolase